MQTSRSSAEVAARGEREGASEHASESSTRAVAGAGASADAGVAAASPDAAGEAAVVAEAELSNVDAGEESGSTFEQRRLTLQGGLVETDEQMKRLEELTAERRPSKAVRARAAAAPLRAPNTAGRRAPRQERAAPALAAPAQ